MSYSPRLDLTEARAYATQDNLRKALAKYNLDKYQHVECRTPEGKWTAVFTFAHANRVHGECYVCFASQFGFMTV